VAGWIKRGPSGVIGTNKKDAQDTVDKILEDAAGGRLNQPVAEDIDAMIAEHAPQAVTWEGWEAIDAIETAAGAASEPGRPRVKLTEWGALREAAERALTPRSR
jgi:ferredoxin--NADP+ reductase